MMSEPNVAFIGLGVMGFPMAGWLSKAGYSVTVFNRTTNVAERWRSAYKGTVARTPVEAAQAADIVFTCVGNDDDVRDVALGEKGILSGIRNDAVLVDHTTTSAKLAREISASLQNKTAHFIDAPVSGGQQGAENGKLTIMCGGETSVFERVRPVMQSYARSAVLLGPVGSGQLCKMVNQICIAGLIESLAEGMNFAVRAGLDPELVVDVISKGAAQSWQMENRAHSMLAGDYDHGFAVDWMRKDLAIALEEGASNGSELPVVALVDSFYAEVQEMGGNRWDTSSLLQRLRKKGS